MKIGDFIASFIRASFEYGWSVLGKVIHFNIINSKITQFVCLFVMLSRLNYCIDFNEV